jgi:GNAT superfamily N-acetyltransferase
MIRRVKAHCSADVEEYAAAVLAFLEAAPCERNVLRSILERVRTGDWLSPAPATWFWVEDAGVPVAAASWTPPWPLLVSEVPPGAAPPLVAVVHDAADRRGLRLAGVNGPASGARTVAAAWSALTGRGAAVHMRQLLHELTTVSDPPRPPGRARPAAPADIETLVDMLVRFSEELGLLPPADPRGTAERGIAQGSTHVWEDGAVVSMTGCVLPLAGVARVGPVYTPPDCRNRGYARALVAEVSRRLLDRGADRCVLYTDQANPVSNSIYRQVGYVPTGEAVELRFVDGPPE